MTRPKRWAVITMAAAIAATLWAATMVVAGGPVTVTGTGVTITRLKTISDTNGDETSSATFVNVPGATRSVQLNSPALVIARFTAESTCFFESNGVGPQGPNGDPPGLCRVRIIATKAGPTVVELSPASGSNYSFDTFDNSDECTGGCELEGHALERSATLPTGTWDIQVQFAVGAPSGPNIPVTAHFILDDWNLSVERWSS